MQHVIPAVPAVTMDLIEMAKRMTPELASTAAEDNSLRRLSEDTWRILLDSAFVRSLQPARWGGGEVSLVEFTGLAQHVRRFSLAPYSAPSLVTNC